MTLPAIQTPQTHPDHPVIGQLFVATDFMTGDWQIYYCDSYDPRQGYWLTALAGRMFPNGRLIAPFTQSTSIPFGKMVSLAHSRDGATHFA